MKEKKNKKLEEFAKKVEDLIANPKVQVSEIEKMSLFSKESLVKENINTNIFLNLHGEEKYNKWKEKFKK